MAISWDFLGAASILWPQAWIPAKLQVFMASSHDFLQAATIHGFKPRFPPIIIICKD
jgi:hypothetical protein